MEQDGQGFDDEDMELQLALALSLQESSLSSGGASGGAAAPAAPPPATTAATPAPNQPAGSSATAPSGGNNAQLEAMLQQSLAMLLGGGQPAGASAVAAPPPAPAAAAAPPLPPLVQSAPPQLPGPALPASGGSGGGANNSSSSSQSALHASLAQGLAQFLNQMQQQQAPAQAAPAPTAAPAAASGAPAQRPQQRNHQGHHSSAAAAPATPKPLPDWSRSLKEWWTTSGTTATAAGTAAPTAPLVAPNASVVVSGAELPAVCGHLSAALKPLMVVSESSKIGATSLYLKTSAGPSGGDARQLAAADMEALVSTSLLRRGVGPKDKLQALHGIFAALPAPGSATGGAAAALALAAGVTARLAFALVKDDEEDLYYEQGQNTLRFIDALAGGEATMRQSFLEAMAACAALGEDHAAAWARLVGTALKTFAPARAGAGTAGKGAAAASSSSASGPLRDLSALSRCLAVLDGITRPPVMQRLLAATLLREVSTLASLPPAAQGAWIDKNSVLAPMLGLSPWPALQDAVMRTTVVSPAREGFTECRGYPRQPGAATPYQAHIHQVLSRIAFGSEQVFLRLVRLKDGDVFVGREVALSWAAAVARVNTVRAKFGEATEIHDLRVLTAGSSDGLLLNLLAAMLRLAKPFTDGWLDRYRASSTIAPASGGAGGAGGGGPGTPGGAGGGAASVDKFKDLFEKHFNPSYYSQYPHRAGDISTIAPLAGPRGTGLLPVALPPPSATSSPNPTTTPPPATSPPSGVGVPPLLAASLPSASSSSSPSSASNSSAAAPPPPPPSFMADVFFITQQLLVVGTVAAINRFRAVYTNMSRRSKAAAAAGGASGGSGDDDDADAVGPSGAGPAAALASPQQQALALELHLFNDCSSSHLLEPNAADDAASFAVMQLDWLYWLAVSPARRTTLRGVPEWALSAPLDLMTYLLQAGRADIVASKPVPIIMRALVYLLDCPEAVRSPLLHNKVVNLLLACLAPQLADAERRSALGGAGMLAPDRMNAGERALVAAVLGTPTAQAELVPALMRAYVGADTVVGLDVDKDAFDKYTMRAAVDQLLGALWQDDVIRRGMVGMAVAAVKPAQEGGDPLFGDYVSAVVAGLIHCFKDSLDRLADIHKIEEAKADKSGWAARPASERQQQEVFMAGQQRAARGFLRLAKGCLNWLATLTSEPTVGRAFTSQPLCGKAAYAVVACADLLLGSRAAMIKVAQPVERYGFDRPALVAQVLRLGTALGQQDAFARALAEEPDYEDEVFAAGVALLESSHQHMLLSQLKGLLEKVAEYRGGATPMHLDIAPASATTTSDAATAAAAAAADTTAGGAATGVSPPLKRRKSGEGLPDVGGSTNGTGGAESAPDAMEVDSVPAAVASGLRCMALSFPSEETSSGMSDSVAPSAPTAISPALEQAYKAALGPLALAPYSSSTSGGYARQVADEAARSGGDTTGSKMRRLMKEIRDMGAKGKTPLPCNAAAAVFVRHDEDTPDRMRAIVTGPQGTPYDGGLFIFDAFFPDGYPNVPPLLVMYNTGDGRGRFNPNLYADGKVCLSILGTWHSAHESEKWNPNNSTMFQVLLSIQAQVLVEDPYFNEPSYEAVRGTAEGKAASLRYNGEIQLHVLRYAMTDLLKRPPPGCEEVIRQHFRLQRSRLLATVQQWVAAAAWDPALQRRMDAAVVELAGHLAKL